MKNAKLSVLMLIAFLTACVTPRVSTPTERQVATATLNVLELGVNAAHLAGKLSDAQHLLATKQLVELRGVVTNSETVPVDWNDLTMRLGNFSLAWLGANRTQ